MNPTGRWHPRSDTAQAGNTRASLAPSRSGRQRCGFCWWSLAGPHRTGRGGNVEALAASVALLRYEGRDVAWCSCTAANADAHAGHTETSVLLHISPQDVWLDERLPGNRSPLAELMP